MFKFPFQCGLCIPPEVHWLHIPKWLEQICTEISWTTLANLEAVGSLKWVENNTQYSYLTTYSHVWTRDSLFVYFSCKKYPKIRTETLAQVCTSSFKATACTFLPECAMTNDTVDLKVLVNFWGTLWVDLKFKLEHVPKCVQFWKVVVVFWMCYLEVDLNVAFFSQSLE